jgi:hypothetical protein
VTLSAAIGVLPTALAYAAPCAMLFTICLVYGRMSADNEITAIRASGVGLGRMASPVILLALAMTALCFYINTTLAPMCRFQFRTLFLQLATENPMALLEEGVAIRDFPGYEIYIGNKKANMIEDVRIMALDDKGCKRAANSTAWWRANAADADRAVHAARRALVPWKLLLKICFRVVSVPGGSVALEIVDARHVDRIFRPRAGGKHPGGGGGRRTL